MFDPERCQQRRDAERANGQYDRERFDGRRESTWSHRKLLYTLKCACTQTVLMCLNSTFEASSRQMRRARNARTNNVMNDKESHSALMSALTTEHMVLQAAASATVSDAAARSSLYVFSLSSSLVAMGFASRSREVFVPFIVTVLPSLFQLGLFTVIRLVD